MDVVDLLITIVVVTILITIVLAVVTYVAYKLRLAREPSELDRAGEGLRFFVQYVPPGARGEVASPSLPGSESHATEA
ncbi:MAG TPA: hypothetical protein VLA09_10215 [Longimicrobiales bacterium]|nr:hypothetical protein [Longimicrobiales bacterium]